MATRLADDLDVEDGVYYPSSDGKPMAETPVHARCMVLLFQALEDFFRTRPEVYVALNMNWYWEQGNPRARRARDVMVIPGVGPAEIGTRSGAGTRTGQFPPCASSMASLKTWKKNLGASQGRLRGPGGARVFHFRSAGAVPGERADRGIRLRGYPVCPAPTRPRGGDGVQATKAAASTGGRDAAVDRSGLRGSGC